MICTVLIHLKRYLCQRMYIFRYSLYIDAVAEVLNTGKGVVLDRSPFSDFVFVEAMYQQGYLSKEGTFSCGAYIDIW